MYGNTDQQPATVGDERPSEFDMSREISRARLSKKKRVWRLLAVGMLIAPLLIVAALAALLRYADLPASAAPQSTLILDSAGRTIASLQGGVNRRTVALSEMSPWLVQATIAIEDRRFYRHAGVDFRGLARAAWTDLRHLSMEQGASTLTQQLARNLYLTHERTWSRKLKEAWYAIQLERKYSKDEILELYLNQIYYGHGAYGAEAAAQLYFGKSARELTLAESALLAGIPKGPRYYSPHLQPEQARKRQRIVLEAMARSGAISDAEAAEAARTETAVRPLPRDKGQTAPYFVDYVKRVAVEQLGIDERLLSEGGLVVTTTLDERMQRAAEDAIAGQLPRSSELQAALIAIDPATGHIKAMVGGRDYRANQFNRVFARTRQPGSSFKPILYAAALGKGAVTPATRFRSEPTTFYYDDSRKIYRPSNYNDRYFHEEIGLRQAIRASDNIYAVHTIMQVGPQEVIDMARKLGVTAPLEAVPSLALGTFPVSPYEMASAFTAFAGGGLRADPIAIMRVEDRDGRVLYEARPRLEQAMSPALAYVMTDLMKSVFERGGTAHRVASMIRRPIAGKSGTTRSDAWFVGYTPELTAAVWVGYDRGRAITSTEAHRAAPIFARFMEDALADVPPSAFVMPDGVVTAYINPENGLLASPGCPHKQLETFVAGTEPQQMCMLHGGLLEERREPQRQPDGWWSRVRRWWSG